MPTRPIKAHGHCPCLEQSDHPGQCIPLPSADNICRADPLHRRQRGDLPLMTQVSHCFSPRHARCPIWQASHGRRLSLAGFLFVQARAALAVCLRALLA